MPEISSAQSNIETITRLEEQAEVDRSLSSRLSETIGRFAGTLSFALIQMVLVGVWVLINIRGAAFDPYPFPFLAGLLAFEAVLLTSFILISQTRMSLRADRRNHLALQINLLSEQEATKIIQMLQRMSRQMGIEGAVTDSETRALSTNTSIDGLVRDLRVSLGETAPNAVPPATDPKTTAANS